MRRYISYIIFFLLGLAFTAFVYAQGSPSQKWVNAIESYFNGTNYVNVSSTNQLPVNASGSNNLQVSNTVPYTTDVYGGTLTALDSVFSSAVTGGIGTSQVRIQGTWVGTISFELSLETNNGYILVPAEAYPVGGGLPVTSTTANGEWNIPLTGLSSGDSIKVEMTSYTSGTAGVGVSEGGPPGIVTAVQPTGSNLNETPNLNNSPVSITNGLWTVPGRIQAHRFVWADQIATLAGINACLIGNANSTDYITGFSFNLTALTAGNENIDTNLYSTLASGGTSSALNPISTNGNTLYVTGLQYSASPTAGTLLGSINSFLNYGASTITTDATVTEPYINLQNQPIKLVNGSELCIEANAAGDNLSFNFYGYEIP